MTKQAKPKGTLEQILELHNLFFLPNLVRHHGAAFFFFLSLSLPLRVIVICLIPLLGF